MDTKLPLLIGGLMIARFTSEYATAQVTAAAPQYEVIDLGTLGGDYSTAYGINDRGQVVGSSVLIKESFPYERAFLYANGSMQDLGVLWGDYSQAYGINNSGQVVGYFGILTSGNWQGFLYTDGVMQDLGTLGGGRSIAYGINNKGQVVGESTIPDIWSETQSRLWHAFLYTGGGMRDLTPVRVWRSIASGINDHGQVVGSSTLPDSSPRAFLYSNGSMKDLGTLGGKWGSATGINNRGQVVGSSETKSGADHGFLYTDGVMQDLGTLGGWRSVAYGINDNGQVVGYFETLSGDDRAYRAFLYTDGVMRDLHDLINKDSGWRLDIARAINNAGQIVGGGISPSGKYHAFLLNPLPEWRRVIETQPIQPTYSEAPKKEGVKDSLVVVTHGWNPDIKWLEGMTNAITTYLVSNGLKNWEVHAHKWEEKARTSLLNVLSSAEKEGENLGQRLATNKWRHIHLIAHSAGSALIQTATDVIKEKSPTTTVHLTFLDAYNGIVYGGKNKYGRGADWVDSYFSRDPETVLTDKILPNTYNVDVTLLDANKQSIQVYASTSFGEVSETCYQTVSSHGWPYQFYTSTIPPNTLFGSQGFGFPLSREGGNWSKATNSYTVGANKVETLGSGELVCTPNPSTTQLRIELPLDFSKLPGAALLINAPEKVNIRGIDFTLRTASPAWLAATLPITNRVNLVAFEAVFTSVSNAEGLLSVYWETNIVGSIDERVALSGIRQYKFPIPGITENGTRTLGFRLDAFSATQSIATITNVALGFAGVKEPFSLSLNSMSTNGLPVLMLTGPDGSNYRVESSTNLTNWATIAILTNTNGTVRFVDSSTNKTTTRFYRAATP